jgi:parvulin-like peptidyl-prolyl isomerase
MERFRVSARPLGLLVLPALLAAALLAGCSSDSTTLAKIGERVITMDEFLDVARQAQGQYRGAPDSARATLLDDLVKRQLLVGAAHKLGLVSAEDQERMRRQAMEQLAMRALVEQLAPADAPVSDAEVEALYRRGAQEARALIVFAPDEAAIRDAAAQVRGGADFGATADRFNTMGMTPRGGDLGFVAPGTLPAVLDSTIEAAALGQVHGPVGNAADGWFLVRVLERRPREQPPLEQVRDQLRMSLQQSKWRAALGRIQQDLIAQYHVRTEPGAAQVVFQRYNAPRDTTVVGAVRVAVPAPPTQEEAARVLVRYDGKPGTYTLGDAVADLQDPGRQRPDFQVMPMIEQWLTSMVVQRVATQEIARRHLAEEPALARQAQGQADNALLRAAYQALVVEASGPPTEENVRAAYTRHAAEIVDRDGKPIDYAAIDEQVRQALVFEAAEMRREQRLVAVTESLRAQAKPVVRQERLKRIPWPVPPAARK